MWNNFRVSESRLEDLNVSLLTLRIMTSLQVFAKLNDYLPE